MKVANETVVSMHYTLKNKSGEVLDSSEGKEPLAYLQGAGNIIPGLEKALENREAGDKFDVEINPQDAYGMVDEELIKTVPKTQFPADVDVQPGMQFQLQSQQGNRIATVVRAGDEGVVLDLNHPLAGETLCFAVEVVEVRVAKKEELEHGHVHGPDGHHH